MGGTVTGLEYPVAVRREVARIRHAARAEKQRTTIGDDVAEHVRRDDHVETARVGDELIHGVVDLEFLQPHAGCITTLVGDFAPQRTDGRNTARFGRHRDQATAFGGQPRGDIDDPCHLRFPIAEAMVRDAAELRRVLPRPFAQIETAGVLAYRDDVHGLESVGTHGAAVTQWRVRT